MCIHVCSTARMQLLPVLDFSSLTIFVSNIVCILSMYIHVHVVGDGVQGAVMYQCSPQAVLAYRANIPYVWKGYRPICLRPCACTALAQRTAN